VSPGAPSAHDLYLSPHYDDICYSLGNHVAWRGRGKMLVVFSRSDYIFNARHIEAAGFNGLDQEAKIAHATAVRRGEDQRFAAEVGLTVTYCGFDEAPVRGNESNDARFARQDTPHFAAAIMERIRALAGRNNGSRPSLYCPLGIGGHVDHLVVRDTVLANLAELLELYTPHFYEDLPYASNHAQRRAGLRDFIGRLGSARPRRLMLPIDDFVHKTALVEIYSSQIYWPRPAIVLFTPQTGAEVCPPHEALWVL
jgi:hypothetical protein